MKLGLLLPQVRSDFEPSLRTASRAEAEGISGVFAFDHVWTPGLRNAPVLAPFPLLAAVAAATQQVQVGTLIARVDTIPIDDLVNSFRTLKELAGDRVIAGLGYGDQMTVEEDEFCGIPPKSFAVRLELLEEATLRLTDEGIPLWLAGASDQVATIAKRQNVPVHLWNPAPERVKQQRGRFTWGCVLDGSIEDSVSRLNVPLKAGASWAVCGYRGGTDKDEAFKTIVKAGARLG